MPNILDIRRRIRSVVNTRQITKAMKSGLGGKAAQGPGPRVCGTSIRQMLTNVLQSLVTRAEIYDPETGEIKHPLLAQRPERNILLIVVTGDKGLAGGFNSNLNKAAARFLESKTGVNIDIEAIGRKGRDFLRRRYPASSVQTVSLDQLEDNLDREHAPAERAAATQIVGEHVGVLGKVQFSQVRRWLRA